MGRAKRFVAVTNILTYEVWLELIGGKDLMAMTWRDSSWARLLFTALRIYVGWSWLTSGFGKVFGANSAVWVGDKAGVAVNGFLQGALTKTTGAHPDVQWWYASFIKNFALPNAKIFGYMVAWGELLVGIGLIVGAFTVVALLAGMLMNFNYLLAGTVSSNPVFLIEQLVLLYAGAATIYWSVDRLLPQANRLFHKKR